VRLLIFAVVAFFLVLWVRAVIDVFRRRDLSPRAREPGRSSCSSFRFVGLLVYTLLRPANA
jgi:hypothetical protein